MGKKLSLLDGIFYHQKTIIYIGYWMIVDCNIASVIWLSAGVLEWVFLLCYHSIEPCISKGDLSVSAICYLCGFMIIDWHIDSPS